MSETNSDLVGVFPPRTVWDIAAYPTDDCVEGYRDHSVHEPFPGDNRTPGYRWGWQNARNDATYERDGYEGLRSEYINMSRHPQ